MTYIPKEERWPLLARALVEERILSLRQAGKTAEEIATALTPLSLKGLTVNPLKNAVVAFLTRYDARIEHEQRMALRNKTSSDEED